MKNHYKKVSIIAWVITIILFIACFLPLNLGMDGMNGGFALIVFLGFGAVSALITAIIYGLYARKYQGLLKKDNILANWQYTSAEWKVFTEEEYKTDKSAKMFLFYIIAGWALLFGILFPIFDNENGIFVTYVMLGLIVIIFITAKLSIRHMYKLNKRNIGQAFIAKDGIMLNNQLYYWKVWPSRLVGVNYKTSKSYDYLEFTIDSGRENITDVRIPIPKGKEDEAKNLLTKFNLT